MTKIIVVCYSRIEIWNSRKKAMEFYEYCARNCEGCERDRYMNVYWDLKDGLDVAHDGASLPYETLKELGRYMETDAPDKSRDFGGRIWYSKD